MTHAAGAAGPCSDAGQAVVAGGGVQRVLTDQHAFLLAKLLGRVDALDADLAELETELQELIAPLAHPVERLDEIPGVGQTAAPLLLAEIGRT